MRHNRRDDLLLLWKRPKDQAVVTTGAACAALLPGPLGGIYKCGLGAIVRRDPGHFDKITMRNAIEQRPNRYQNGRKGDECESQSRSQKWACSPARRDERRSSCEQKSAHRKQSGGDCVLSQEKGRQSPK